MSRHVYLDFAAATPMDPEVLRAMEPFFAEEFYNPSAGYLSGREVRRHLEKARTDVASALGTRSAEIIFTAGATEANNLAISGIMRQFPDGEALVTAIEHESVLEPAKQYKHRLIPVTKEGLIDLAKLERMITPQTKLVSVGLVNNEIGTVQPLAQIAKLLGPRIFFHSDAAQAPNYFDLHVARYGVHLMTINGGKIYGPKQSGVLYIRAGTRIQPLIVGGGQELNLRSGTENVPAAIGLAGALSLAQKNRKSETARLNILRQLFIGQLLKAVPAVIINGSAKHSAPHIVSATFPGQDNERLMMQLDEAGILVATGSACAASSRGPSHVLSALGLTEKLARATLRFSFGRKTVEDDIRYTVQTIKKLLEH